MLQHTTSSPPKHLYVLTFMCICLLLHITYMCYNMWMCFNISKTSFFWLFLLFRITHRSLEHSSQKFSIPDAVLHHSDSLLAQGLSSQLLGVLQADGPCQ